MAASPAILFDSGRFPLWLRLPALAFGLLTLWLGFSIATASMFGVSLGIPMSDLSGSPLLGSLACFLIAAIWIFPWFAQLQILFDETQQEMVVRTRGYFRSHERCIPLAGVRAFHLRHVPTVLASSTWRVTVEFSDGRSERVTDLPSGVESLAASLEAATKLPVRRYE